MQRAINTRGGDERREKRYSSLTNEKTGERELDFSLKNPSFGARLASFQAK